MIVQTQRAMQAQQLAAIRATAKRKAAVDPDAVLALVAEVERLHSVLCTAVHAMAAAGLTPETREAQPTAVRDSELWTEVLEVWSCPEAAFPRSHAVLTFTRDGMHEQRDFPTLNDALQAAIMLIETNGACPEAIEFNGEPALDQSAILCAWTDRHNPG